MNILILSSTIPGYAPNELHKYLRGATSHQIDLIQSPAYYERKSIQVLSYIENIKKIKREVKELDTHWDIVIAPDPASVSAACNLRKKDIVDKVIYWRLDYHSLKYQGLLNKVYQYAEEKARITADQIWSIADPSLPRIEKSLGTTIKKTIHVPYLLHDMPVFHEEREDFALWMGPDLEESKGLCWDATRKLGLKLEVCDYSVERFRKSEDELESLLKVARVGLSPYKPHYQKKGSKYYCDSSRIRRFLAYGVPVVTTDVAPTHTTLIEENCGSVVQWSVKGLIEGLQYCLDNFDELSKNALKAAKEYTFQQWFPYHQIL